MNVETVFPRVAKIIVKVLCVEEREVSLKKNLIDDLGAESIDFLDLVFRLEREFKIKLPKSQFDLPDAPQEKSRNNPSVKEISHLFTVEAICNLVATSLRKKEESPSQG